MKTNPGNHQDSLLHCSASFICLSYWTLIICTHCSLTDSKAEEAKEMLVNAAQLRLRTLEQQLNGDEESEGLPSPQHSPLPSPRLEHLRHPQMVDRKAVTLKEAPSSGLPSPHASPPSSWHAYSDTASQGLPSPVPSPRLFDAEINVKRLFKFEFTHKI